MYMVVCKRTRIPDSAAIKDKESQEEKENEHVEISVEVLAEIPEELRKDIEEENKKYAEDKAEHQRKMDTLDLRIFYGNTPIMIHINKYQTLRDAKVH